MRTVTTEAKITVELVTGTLSSTKREVTVGTS